MATERYVSLVTALNAVTATTSSSVIPIKGAKKVTLAFTRANHSSGSTAFTVTASIDGSTYVAYNKLITNSTNAIGEGLVRVASVSLSSNTTSLVSMDLDHDTLDSIIVTATETTDGTHTAKVLIEY